MSALTWEGGLALKGRPGTHTPPQTSLLNLYIHLAHITLCAVVSRLVGRLETEYRVLQCWKEDLWAGQERSTAFISCSPSLSLLPSPSLSLSLSSLRSQKVSELPTFLQSLSHCCSTPIKRVRSLKKRRWNGCNMPFEVNSRPTVTNKAMRLGKMNLATWKFQLCNYGRRFNAMKSQSLEICPFHELQS